MWALQQRFWDTALFATSHQAGSFFPNLRLPKMWREICQKIWSEVRSNLQKISGLCICYFDLLLFDKYFWRRKIQLADEKTEYCNLMRQLVHLWKCKFFISQFVFRRQPDEFFFSKKFVKWKQTKITSMILQKRLVEVWVRLEIPMRRRRIPVPGDFG